MIPSSFQIWRALQPSNLYTLPESVEITIRHYRTRLTFFMKTRNFIGAWHWVGLLQWQLLNDTCVVYLCAFFQELGIQKLISVIDKWRAVEDKEGGLSQLELGRKTGKFKLEFCIKSG